MSNVLFIKVAYNQTWFSKLYY